MNPATTSDLVARSLRPLTGQETTTGGILLDDAWNIITSRIPTAATQAAHPGYAALVVQIECAMVLRVLNNPTGLLQETIDDYTYRRDAAVSTGVLYLGDEEQALLTADDDQPDTAFTIRPAFTTPACDPDRGWHTTRVISIR